MEQTSVVRSGGQTRLSWISCAALLLCAGCGLGDRNPVGIDEFRLGMTKQEVRSTSSSWSSLNVFGLGPFLIFQMQNDGGAQLSPFGTRRDKAGGVAKSYLSPGRLNIALLADSVVSVRGETSWVEDFEILKVWLKQREGEFTKAYGRPEQHVAIDAMKPDHLRTTKDDEGYLVCLWELDPAVITIGVEAHLKRGKTFYGAVIGCADVTRLKAAEK